MKRPASSRIRLSFLVLFACLGPASLHSQEPTASPTYRVEMLVFKANTALGTAENWGAREMLRDAGEDTAAAGGAAETARLVRLLGPAELQLRETANRLRASGAYEPVAHVGWMQTASTWGTRAGLNVERLGIRVPGLTGTVSLERGQFLHLGMTLDYAMDVPPAGIGAGAGTVFSLDQMRRIRFYERNYYDHPAFGVIALVTPAQRARPTGR